MKKTSIAVGYSAIVTGLILMGSPGCGKKVISNEVADLHARAAEALIQPIHDAMKSGGTVLLVHKQGDNPVLHAWVKTLDNKLDARFDLEVFGPTEMSEAANTSYSGSAPVAEALGAHPECVAVVSTLPIEPEDFRGLPNSCPPIFALEWPFPDAAAPLVQKGVVPAGIFEFYPSMYPDLTPDPATLIGGKYLLLDRQSIAPFGRK